METQQMCQGEKRTVCCMFGGKSTEYEVSLMSVTSVLQQIDRGRYDVMMLGVTKDGRWLYYDGEVERISENTWFTDKAHTYPAMFSPDFGEKTLLIMQADHSWTKRHVDVVFPVMHGSNAEDGTLQGLLTICGIPYVGSGHCASAIAMDKEFTKCVAASLNIPQARHVVVRRGCAPAQAASDALDKLGAFPLFVKPANAGSSIGTGKAYDHAQLCQAIVDALQYDEKAIVEEYIAGREVECAVIGTQTPHVSVPGQIDPGSDFYDYEAKYLKEGSTLHIPAPLMPRTAEEIRHYAAQIYQALGCAGLSRVDFFVCGEGETERVLFNEINTLPGFTDISMYPKLLMYEGMTYPQIIDRLIALACGEETEK